MAKKRVWDMPSETFQNPEDATKGYWCWICFRYVRRYDYFLLEGHLWRRSNEIKWVTLDGEAVPVCPFCKNPLKKQPRELILKRWIKYALMGAGIYVLLRLAAKIV